MAHCVKILKYLKIPDTGRGLLLVGNIVDGNWEAIHCTPWMETFDTLEDMDSLAESAESYLVEEALR